MVKALHTDACDTITVTVYQVWCAGWSGRSEGLRCFLVTKDLGGLILLGVVVWKHPPMLSPNR